MGGGEEEREEAENKDNVCLYNEKLSIRRRRWNKEQLVHEGAKALPEVS